MSLALINQVIIDEEISNQNINPKSSGIHDNHSEAKIGSGSNIVESSACSSIISKPAVPWSYYSNTGQRTRAAELDSHLLSQPLESHLISIAQYDENAFIPATFILEKSQPEGNIMPQASEDKVKNPMIPANLIMKKLQPEDNATLNNAERKSEIQQPLNSGSCNISIITLPITPNVQIQAQNNIRKAKISENHPKPAVPWSYYNLQAKAHLHENKLNRIVEPSSDILKKMVPPRARDVSTHSRLTDYPDELQF